MQGMDATICVFPQSKLERQVFPNDMYYLPQKRTYRGTALYFMDIFIMIMETIHSEFQAQLQLTYTGCNRRNGPDFGRVFLMLNYTEKPPKHLYPKLNGFRDNGQ